MKKFLDLYLASDGESFFFGASSCFAIVHGTPTGVSFQENSI